MQNIAEFHIIGRIGKFDRAKDVTHLSVAANYNRRDGDEWKADPHWNRVTVFGKLRDRLGKAGTLTEMTKRLEEMAENLDCIEEHPAMQVTPDSFGRRIEAAAEAARRGDQTRIDNAYNELRQAAQDMRGVTSHARNRADQHRKVFRAVGGGVLGGILLWSFLPGTIARTMPENWHWPERMAARMVGESSRWDAGTRLMRSESPQALNALERAADLLRDNREAIEAYQKSASNSKQPVRCTVRIQTESESRN